MSQPVVRPPTFEEYQKQAEQSGLRLQVQRQIRDYDEKIMASIEAELNATSIEDMYRHLRRHLSDAKPYVDKHGNEEQKGWLTKAFTDTHSMDSGGPKTAVRQSGSFGHVIIVESSRALASDSKLPLGDPRYLETVMREDHIRTLWKKWDRLNDEVGWVDNLLAEHGVIPRKPRGTMPGIHA